VAWRFRLRSNHGLPATAWVYSDREYPGGDEVEQQPLYAAPSAPLPAGPPGVYVDIVFDGPPSHESGRFVEVEDATGASIRLGEWIDRGNGLWALRIPDPRVSPPAGGRELRAAVVVGAANLRALRSALDAAPSAPPVSEEVRLDAFVAPVVAGVRDAIRAQGQREEDDRDAELESALRGLAAALDRSGEKGGASA
jgi:hypothetical protein